MLLSYFIPHTLATLLERENDTMRSLDKLMSWVLTIFCFSCVVGLGSVGWYIYSGKWWWEQPEVAPYRQRGEEVVRQLGESAKGIRVNLPRMNTGGGGNFDIPKTWVDATSHRCAVYISIENGGLVITKDGNLLSTQAIPVSVGSGAPEGVFTIPEVKRGQPGSGQVEIWLPLTSTESGSSSGNPAGIYNGVGRAPFEGAFAVSMDDLKIMEEAGCFTPGTPVLIQKAPSQWTNSKNLNFGRTESGQQSK